ncbi:MAG: WD40 repeat domain-containing protein [Chloroflexota bacterium]|nr:MAG: WD40 repeat domain-containing protein [Chloroflexota bacterium]
MVESQLPVGDAGEFVVYGFSPDGGWLAYSPRRIFIDPDYGLETSTINLLSNTGEQIENPIDVSRFEGTEGDVGYFVRLSQNSYWINNQLLYTPLGSIPKPGEGTMGTSIPAILDPFSGKWEGGWIDTLPYRNKILPSRFGVNEIAVSPDLARALYPTNRSGIVLYDLLNNQILWKDTKFAYYSGNIARWSPDGTMVVVGGLNLDISDRVVSLISYSGEKLTDVIDSKFTINPYPLRDLAWSPDSRLISLVISNSPDEIYIYDVQQQKFLYRCPLAGLGGYYRKMIWSPDSKWIAVSDLDSPFLIMNVQTGDMYRLLDHASIAVGWSDKFPIEWP